MLQEFSEMETGIIRNMMLTRSAKDIASLLDRDTKEVANALVALANGTGVITHQAKLETKMQEKKAATIAKPREKRIRVTQKKEPAKRKLTAKKAQAVIDKRRKEEEKAAIRRHRLSIEQDRLAQRKTRGQQFATKQVDYTKMVTIRIDRTTTIYSKPGEEEVTKAKFLKTYSRPLDKIV